jgi:hypothetical protein
MENKPAETKPPFGLGTTTPQSTEPKPAYGGFGQPQLQQQATTTEQKQMFGGFGQTASSDKPQTPTTFIGFGQSSTTTSIAPGQPTESKSAFGGFGQPSQLTATEKPTESSLTSGGFGQTSTLTTEKPKPTFGGPGQMSQYTTPASEKPASTFGGFSQLQQQPQQSTPSDRPGESKSAFGGFSTTAKQSPWQTASTATTTTTTKPTDSKPFNFSSAPTSVSTTPKPPEPQTTGFTGFKLSDSTVSSKDQSGSTLAVPKPLGGFGELAGLSTPGTSTAATSVSGDSTSTTPAPVKKDFAIFGGVTPTGTPGPGEKEGEKKGFGLDKEKGTEGEKKIGFAGFPTKKDEPEVKKDEKPVGFGLGEKGTLW